MGVEKEIGTIKLDAKPEEKAGPEVHDEPTRPPPLPPARPPSERASCSNTKKASKQRTLSQSPVGSIQHSFHRTDYAPAVSSPLRTDGSTEMLGEEFVRGTSRKRRSLQIRVAETEKNLLDVDRESSSSPEAITQSGMGAASRPPRPRKPSTSASVNSPATSFQLLGGDFSRYPLRQSLAIVDPAAPGSRTPTPLGIPVSGPSEGNGNAEDGFKNNDPERGFSPYIVRSGVPVTYPALDEKEDDDDLHNPDENENQPFKIRDCRRTCNPRLFLTILSVVIFMLGLLCLFILWPVLKSTKSDRGKSTSKQTEKLSNITYPILGAIRTSLIDPNTPDNAKTRQSVLGRGNLKLVFSDEFTTPGRTFYEGEDQFWQAADLHYAATQDLEWYDPDAITTANGTLQLRMEEFLNHNLKYRSGMLQSWNKMCFKGGVMEVSASLAGPAGVPGLWPGIWSLGNLARPGYRATSDGVWPYSYDQCDAGITPNQSSPDGLSFLPGQRLSSCTCKGEDHPSPGNGRGAPEIDALEGTAEYEKRIGVVTQSSQIAPFDVFYAADTDFMAIKNYEITQLNGWRGGPFQQAVSGVTMLNNNWYSGNQYQKYAFEYVPGQEDGEIAWFVGDEETFRMTGNSIGPNGNIGQRDVSKEPMSIILNLGLSESWTWIDWEILRPALAKGTIMYIDYVRIYQEEGKELLTCDPRMCTPAAGYETTEYIQEHIEPYRNANMTTWSETDFPWPKNKLMHGCK